MIICRKKSLPFYCLLCAVAVLICSTVPVLAAEEMTVKRSEYNLVVDDYPNSMEPDQLYAKFIKEGIDAKDYVLSLFDDNDSEQAIAAALKKSGDSIDNYISFSMEILLYEKDKADGEFYPADIEYGSTLICPISKELEGVANAVQLYMVNDKKKAEEVELSVVTVNGKKSYFFHVNKYTEYAFLLDKETYEQFLRGEYADKEPTAAPTKTPAENSGDQPQKEPTKTPTVKPTKVPDKPGDNAQSGKDKTPQTGDTYNPEASAGIIAGAGTALMGLLYYAKKKLL